MGRGVQWGEEGVNGKRRSFVKEGEEVRGELRVLWLFLHIGKIGKQ